MDQLRAHLDAAVEGRGSLVMLAGEPGIGKTRLAEELTAIARAKGLGVAWGRCWEGEGAPPYWPWVQILQSRLHDESSGALASLPAAAVGELSRIAPELAAEAGQDRQSLALDSDADRFRLFDAVSRFLQMTAREQPLVLVLDDLHWADEPSILLLHFVARHLGAQHVLVIGTYRDVEVGRDHPLLGTLSKLARESSRLSLPPLSASDIARLIQLATGEPAAGDFVAELLERTDGNPFFVGEIVRLAPRGSVTTSGDSTVAPGVPQGVREVLWQRLNQLSRAANQMLTVASVIGREFDLDLLAQVSPTDGDKTSALLAQAATPRIVEPIAGDSNRYRFAHMLIRDTLYEEIPPRTRSKLHGRIAEALEALSASKGDKPLGALAYHFFESASTAHLAKALQYCIAAGQHATASGAFEEGAVQYRRALKAQESSDPDAALQCQILLMLGDAESRGTHSENARETFRRAAIVAGGVGDADRFARAALGFGGRFVTLESGWFDEELVNLLRDALDRLGDRHSPLYATALARLSRALYYSEPQEQRMRLAQRALRIARSTKDGEAELAALNARFWALWGPEHSQRRLTTATSIVKVADQLGAREASLQGHLWRLTELVELGDMVGMEAELKTFGALADELGQALYLWLRAMIDTNWALLEGRYREGERLAEEALALGVRGNIPVARRAYEQALFWPRREQGLAVSSDLSGLEALIAKRSPRDQRVLPALTILAFTSLERGENPKAAEALSRISAQDIDSIPRDLRWAATMGLLAEVCASLPGVCDTDHLYELLAPYTGKCVRFEAPIDYYLGRLSIARGRWGDAHHFFQRAIATSASVGARPWVARAGYEYAAAMAHSGEATPEQWRRLLAQSSAIAAELGMSRLTEQIEALDGYIGTAGLSTGDQRNVISREGPYSTIRYQGREIKLKQTKGLDYLAVLLLNPGQEIHAADLVGMLSSPGGPGNRPEPNDVPIGSPSHTGEVIDRTARHQYRQRLTDLEEDIQEAKDNNDTGRLEGLEFERDALVQALVSAYGLGGRVRKGNDMVERLRKSVSNRIRPTLSRIEEEDPRLGAHLHASVSTGTYCSYNPAEPTMWQR